MAAVCTTDLDGMINTDGSLDKIAKNRRTDRRVSGARTANFIPDDAEQQRIFVVSLKKLKESSMTENTKKELAIFSVGTLVALPVLGGVGLTLLGIVGW